MNRVIVFNGPPRSGKDTAVSTVWQLSRTPCCHIKMAEPITDSVSSLFGYTQTQWNDVYAHHKDTPQSRLHGMTPREACIWMSEEVVKPRFGRDFFGKIAAGKCIARASVGHTVLMSDGGFLEEVECVVDAVGSENVCLVHLHRPGFDFASDSRGLLDPDQLGIPPENFVSLLNLGDREDFQNQLALRVMPLLTSPPSAC